MPEHFFEKIYIFGVIYYVVRKFPVYARELISSIQPRARRIIPWSVLVLRTFV